MSSNYEANIWKIYIFTFLEGFSFAAAVMIPFFIEFGKLNFTQIMILQSWFMLWIFLLEIPTGTIADYLGRKFSLSAGAFAAVAGFIVYGSIPHFYAFLLAEFLIALSVSLISGAKEAIVYDSLKAIKKENKSKKVFANLQSFFLSALVIAPPLGSFVAKFYAINIPILITAIPYAFAGLLAFYIRETKHKKKEKTSYKELLTEGIVFFRKSEVLRILTFDFVAIATVAYFMIWLYQPMLMKAGVDILYFGWVAAAFVLAEIVIIRNFSRLEKLFGSKKNLLTAGAVITGLMFILAGSTDRLLLILLAILLGAGFGLSRKPLYTSYMNKYIPSHNRATVLSTTSMISRIGLVIINPIVGFAVDRSLNITLIGLGILALIAAFISRVEEEHLID